MLEGRRKFIVGIAALSVTPLVPIVSRAGTVMGNGGSTEVTQLLNYGQLVGSYLKQAQMVVNQVQAQVTRVMSYMAMLEHLYQLPTEISNEVIKPWQEQGSLLQKISQSVNGVAAAASQVTSIYSRSTAEIANLKMTGQQWLGAYQQLASSQGSFFANQYASDVAAIGNLATKAQQLQVTAAQNPAITGEVKGLQMLVQQSNVVAAESLDTQALLQRQVSMQTNNAAMKALVDSNSAAAQAAKMGINSTADENEKMLIQGGTFHVLTDSQ